MLAVVAALAALIVVAVVRHRGADSTADQPVPPTSALGPSLASSESRGSPTPTSNATTSTATTTALPPWPTSPGACGNEVPLPLISQPASLAFNTGIRLVAGGTPRTVDVDTGTSDVLPITLASEEFVTALASDTDGIVALVGTCDPNGPSRILRVSNGGAVTSRPVPRDGYFPGELISGGDLVWFSLYPLTAAGDFVEDGAIALVPTDGAATPIVLPKGFIPSAGYRNLIVGNQWTAGAQTTGPIQLYDPATRHVVASYGTTRVSYAVDNGYLAWTPEDCAGRCEVHVVTLADGSSRTITATLLPGRGVWGTISPKGTLLATVTYDNPPDPRYAIDHPGGPRGVAVLNLSTGNWADVPGLELPPKSAVQLAFAGQQQWLAISLDVGDATKVLLWHPGLDHPVDAVEVSGVSGYSPLTVP